MLLTSFGMTAQNKSVKRIGCFFVWEKQYSKGHPPSKKVLEENKCIP